MACRICSIERKLSEGRCDRCRVYFQRTGIERPTDLPVLISRFGECGICKKLSNSLTRGLCTHCSYYNKRYGITNPSEMISRAGLYQKIHPPTPLWEDDNPRWKGEDALPDVKRKRARRRYAMGECEMCGGDGCDRHHKNGNLNDHSRKNILILCRKCHMKIDGRLDRLIYMAKTMPRTRKLYVCIICNEERPPLRKGKCHRCNEFYRRNGVDRPPVINQIAGRSILKVWKSEQDKDALL